MLVYLLIRLVVVVDFLVILHLLVRLHHTLLVQLMNPIQHLHQIRHHS